MRTVEPVIVDWLGADAGAGGRGRGRGRRPEARRRAGGRLLRGRGPGLPSGWVVGGVGAGGRGGGGGGPRPGGWAAGGRGAGGRGPGAEPPGCIAEGFAVLRYRKPAWSVFGDDSNPFGAGAGCS